MAESKNCTSSNLIPEPMACLASWCLILALVHGICLSWVMVDSPPPQCYGMKLVELWENTGQWRGIVLRICPCPYSLSIIQFTESSDYLQTYEPTHAHCVVRGASANHWEVFEVCDKLMFF